MAFDSSGTEDRALEKVAQAAMEQCLGHAFFAVVLSPLAWRELVNVDPFASHGIPTHAKWVGDFHVRTPAVQGGAALKPGRRSRFLSTLRVACAACVRTDEGPIFMRLIERTLRRECTWRGFPSAGDWTGFSGGLASTGIRMAPRAG